MAIEPRPLRTSSPLPPYRAVLAVDAERYTRHSPYHQQILSTTIPTVLEEAFRRSGMEEAWWERRFPQGTGDGYVAGVEPENLPFLVHPLLGHLQEALEDTQPGLASHERELRLRLRVSIDVGPLPDSRGRQEPLDGIGRAMNDTHRLLDSPPVREELRLSDPDTTFVVAIVSGRVFEEAVLGGFTGLRPQRFRPVDVELSAKEFHHEGYLYVPAPSRRPGDEKETAPARAEDRDSGPLPSPASSPAPETSATATANRMNDNYGQAIQSGSIHGGVHGDFRRSNDG